MIGHNDGFNFDGMEKLIFHTLMENPEYISSVSHSFFKEDTIRYVYKIAKQLYEKNGTPPQYYQMVYVVKSNNLADKISFEELQTLYDFDLRPDDRNWVTWRKKLTRTWIKHRDSHLRLLNGMQYFVTQSVNEENIDSIVDEMERRTMKSEVDLDSADAKDFFSIDAHDISDIIPMSTGYDSLDLMMGGGYVKGSLSCVAGAPKVGKSIWLCNLATQFIKTVKNAIYISLEMTEAQIIRRMGQNLFSLSKDDYNMLADNGRLGEYIEDVRGLNDDVQRTVGDLTVKQFSSMSLTVRQLERFVQKTESRRGIKYDVIFLDYLNIMKHDTPDGLYTRVKEIAENLRAIANDNDWAICTATQLKRDADNSDDPTAKDVSESVGLNATVEFLGAIIQTTEMRRDFYYYFKSLLTRETGYKDMRKKFDIDYNFLRLTENSEGMIE